MKILSLGSGMQSSALLLMSIVNKVILEGLPCDDYFGQLVYHPEVPVYDAVVFCDLGLEPAWVYKQTEYLREKCNKYGMAFYILKSPLYESYLEKFGKERVVSIPFWSIDENGKKGKMLRNCTLENKIELIQKFVRYNLLSYRKHQRTKPEDLKAHEMHLGFSKEEEHRCKPNPHKMFVNKFPLCEMGLTRADNYAYMADHWNFITKASACCFCPFHTNYFFSYIKDNHPSEYEKTVEFDELLEREQPHTKIRSQLFISKSRKRIKDLLPADCNDKECFKYGNRLVWNGF